MADRPNTVQVEIFGQVFSVKAGQEPGYIEHLAAYVDAQMREIGRVGSAVDSMKIAVLAALNIADELFRAKLVAHEATQKIEKIEAGATARAEEIEADAARRLREAEEATAQRILALEEGARAALAQ